MTGRRRLVPLQEVEAVIDLLQKRGIMPTGGAIEIRSDGVIFYPPGLGPGFSPQAEHAASPYDQWKAENEGH